MVNMFYALLVLSAGFLLVFGLSLIALARIGKMLKVSEDLNWDQIAAMTGDIGALKKSLQRVNNRINGMEASDPSAVIQALAAQSAQNVTPINQPITKQGG
jgi:hypothetical protein